MIRGIYTAATGMLAQQFVQDALANNLANLNTTAFKQDAPTFRSLHEMALRRYPGASPVGRLGLGSAFDSSEINFAAGPLSSTGNPLDLALNGEGFFVVQTPQGERYARDGRFHVEPAGKGADGKPIGYLADAGGKRVMGEKGPIAIPGGAAVAVSEDGSVIANPKDPSGGTVIDRLKIVAAPPSAFRKEGGNLFSINATPAAIKTMVRSGFLEGANLNPVSEMVRMITVQRAYEAAQRAVTAQDETLGRTVNDIARL